MLTEKIISSDYCCLKCLYDSNEPKSLANTCLILLQYLGYVEEMKKLLFNTTKEERQKIKEKFKTKIPEPLNRQFAERLTKQQAVEIDCVRKRKIAQLYPAGIHVHSPPILTIIW